MELPDFDWSMLDDSAMTLDDFAVPEFPEFLEEESSLPGPEAEADGYDLIELFGLQPATKPAASGPEESAILSIFTPQQLQLTREEFAPLRKQRWHRLLH